MSFKLQWLGCALGYLVHWQIEADLWDWLWHQDIKYFVSWNHNSLPTTTEVTENKSPIHWRKIDWHGQTHALRSKRTAPVHHSHQINNFPCHWKKQTKWLSAQGLIWGQFTIRGTMLYLQQWYHNCRLALHKVGHIHLYLMSLNPIYFLEKPSTLIVPIFAWYVPLVSLIFLKRSLVLPILLFSSKSIFMRNQNRKT